jgi:hypothetical protein
VDSSVIFRVYLEKISGALPQKHIIDYQLVVRLLLFPIHLPYKVGPLWGLINYCFFHKNGAELVQAPMGPSTAMSPPKPLDPGSHEDH